MAEETEVEEPGEKPELEIDDVAPELPKPRRPYRIRKFKLDRNAIAKYIASQVDSDITDRSERMIRRMERRAKLMGWNGPKDWPWKDASQVFIPIMQIANLKTRGTLENAMKSLRPILQSKAKQRFNTGKQTAIDNMLDYQFFVENKGEDIIDSFAANFCEDEAAYIFVQWVKESSSHHDVRSLPPLDQSQDALPQLLQILPSLHEGHLTERMLDNDGWEWEVMYVGEDKRDHMANICFYETYDGDLEAHIVTRMTVHDGPCISVEDYEDIVYPARAANLQPPTPSNPRGAAYFARLCSVGLDTIKRRMQDHTYDLLTDEDWEHIEAGGSPVNSGHAEDEPKQQKDRMEGTQAGFGVSDDSRRQIVWFGRLDVNDDDLDEDVIVWMTRDPDVVCKVALLSEIYPGIPVKRPIVSASFVPISNRIAGISQSELLESLQDVMQTSIDQHIDWGTLTNTPMFFYRAASGLKSEPIRIEPGVGYPLDDPSRDVAFPTWPTKDSSFSINTVTMLQQYVERIEPLANDTSLGRVPMGRSSALRNTGTVTALLGQTNARGEQILRRIFSAFSELFSLMHRLNKRFLPDEKEIRAFGMQEQGQGGYSTIYKDDLDADVDFEFKATLLNSDKQAMAAGLDQVMGMVMTPLAFQAGLVSEEEMYNVLRDKCKALDLDPDRYFKRPASAMGEKHSAEEVISMIVAGESPAGSPFEPVPVHLQKLQTFIMSPGFEMLTPVQSQLLEAWFRNVQMMMQQQMMMMQQMQGAQAGQAGAASAQPQAVGAPGDIGPGSNPPINGNEKIDETIGNQDRFQ
jgi:hypothetical protein